MKANVGFALLTIVGCLRSAQAKPKIQITVGREPRHRACSPELAI